MPILRIEHPVPDFEAWKQAFVSDPLDRKGSGVTRYIVHRSVDDPNYVMVDLTFDDPAAAERMRGSLVEMWQRVQVQGLIGDQVARIIDVVDDVTL